jgi:hypothetical protein
VHGDNQFVDPETARALVHHWSVIQIGEPIPVALAPWTISSKEFREDLEWAVVVPGKREMNPAVQQLLDEIASRGVAIDFQT